MPYLERDVEADMMRKIEAKKRRSDDEDQPIHAKGTMHCPVCGYNSPHGHSENELHYEMVLRPKFEQLFIKLFTQYRNTLVRQPCDGWGKSPADGTGYPSAFGWNGVSRVTNAGGAIAYSDNHWAYRSGVCSPYRNYEVEALWQAYLAIYGGFNTEIETLRARVAQLEAENAQLRADAERYRFLRAHGHEKLEWVDIDLDESLDAAINAALGES